MPCYQLDKEVWFPPVELAEGCGLLAVGGDLSPERLLLAYSLGIFPWYNQDEPILWWSPDPRCVLLPSQLHVSRSLKRFIRKQLYRISFNEKFAAVISMCSQLRAGIDGSGTWINPKMEAAYIRLHELGFAHSVECWDGEQLVGGLYGVCIGRCFFGESMFSLSTNASKVVLVHLLEYLHQQGFELLDCQQTTDHLVSMGATEISRQKFLQYLHHSQVSSSGVYESKF